MLHNLMIWSTSAMHTRCKCKAEGRRGRIGAGLDEVESRLEDDRWMWVMEAARGISLIASLCLVGALLQTDGIR